MGKLRRREVAVKRVARWERVWETWDVRSCVGGRRSGSGPRRREEDKGEWVVRCSSSVLAAGGVVRFFA